MMVPILLLEKIEDFRKRYKLRFKSEAMKQLIETAFLIEEKLPVAEKWTNKDIEEIKESLQTGELVDYIAELSGDKFSLIHDIIVEERKIRGRRK